MLTDEAGSEKCSLKSLIRLDWDSSGKYQLQSTWNTWLKWVHCYPPGTDFYSCLSSWKKSVVSEWFESWSVSSASGPSPRLARSCRIRGCWYRTVPAPALTWHQPCLMAFSDSCWSSCHFHCCRSWCWDWRKRWVISSDLPSDICWFCWLAGSPHDLTFA